MKGVKRFKRTFLLMKQYFNRRKERVGGTWIAFFAFIFLI